MVCMSDVVKLGVLAAHLGMWSDPHVTNGGRRVTDWPGVEVLSHLGSDSLGSVPSDMSPPLPLPSIATGASP